MRKIFDRRTIETIELLRSYKDLTAYTINHFYKIRIYFLVKTFFGPKSFDGTLRAYAIIVTGHGISQPGCIKRASSQLFCLEKVI